MKGKNMNNPTHICIYHKNCSDGFGSALAYKKWADSKGHEVEYIPAQYGDDFPNIDGKHVTIVDFSYPRDALLDMKERAKSLVVIDHHKTAQADLEGLDFCTFDMTKSGAVLTWEYFHPNTPVPLLLLYIQDRDLWAWELEQSKEISASLRLLDFDFDIWEQYLVNDNIPELAVKGEAIIEYQQNMINKIAKSELPTLNIAGHLVPCINTTTLISDIGNVISQGQPFSATYFDTGDKRIYSLRSASDGMDVSAIAKKFGGGGHFHAAGFSVPLQGSGHPVDLSHG